MLRLFAAANRDPRRWDKPDSFDVRRRATGHMTFGTGIHGCVGQALARLETEAVLGALVKRCAVVEMTAEPTRRLNNTLRGIDTLPLRVAALGAVQPLASAVMSASLPPSPRCDGGCA